MSYLNSRSNMRMKSNIQDRKNLLEALTPQKKKKKLKEKDIFKEVKKKNKKKKRK